MLQTLGGLRSLQSQYPKVLYLDAEGCDREHVCDYFMVLADGTRVAVLVKPDRKRLMMLDLMERICAAGFTGIGKCGNASTGVVDAVALMTDVEATYEWFENAYFLLASRDHHDDAECSVLEAEVRRLPGRFRFGQLLIGASSRAARRTAIWRLIDLGIVEPVFSGRIDELAWLRFRP